MAGPQDGLTYYLAIDPSDTTAEVDVTEFVQSFRFNKGRDRETDQYQPASATLTLLDVDRRFDPNNEDGPYSPTSASAYGGLVPLRRFTVSTSAGVENYVALGTNNYVDGTDTAALDITGDIDVRWFGTLNDWQNGNQSLINKWQSTGAQRSWTMECESGSVRVYISTTGADFPFTSAFAVPFADGEYGGVRFTRVQATGTTTIYFSTDDGASWSSAGSTVVSAGTAIFSSSANVNLGGQSSGITNPPTGRVLRAEIRSGVAGAIVAAPNFTTLLAGRNLSFDPLIDDYGITWTGRGAGYDTVVSGGSQFFVGFVKDWYVEYFDGDRMALVTVTFGDGLDVLANTELDTIAAAYAGELSGARVKRVLALPEVDYDDPVAVDAGQSTLGATTFGTNALEYLQQVARAEGGYMFVDRNGTLQFLNRHSLLNDSTTAVDFEDANVGGGGVKYRQIRQTSSADLLFNRATASGVSGVVQTASDATSQAAFKVRTLPIGDTLLSSDAQALSLAQWTVERFKAPEARFSSIEINTMALTDPEVSAVALLDLATLVTVERVPLGNVPAIRYLDFPGTASVYASAPDAGDIDITGNISLVMRVAADDWTPAAAATLLSKWTNTGNQRSYRLDLNTAGTLAFFWSTTGADNPSAVSTVALASTAGVADGEWLWVAVTLDIDEGGSRLCRFWYSTEPTDDVLAVTWTQLGADVTGAVTSIFASTSIVNLSGHTLGTVQPFAGRIANASIRSGVGSSVTVPIGSSSHKLTFDGNADLANVLPTATSFTLTTTGETLTLNGAVTIASQAPDTITRTCVVDGIEHTITPGSWDTIIHLGNADTRPFLTLDHPVLGKLDHNRLAF